MILHKIFVGYDFTSHDTVCEMIYWKHVSVISRGSVLIGLITWKRCSILGTIQDDLCIVDGRDVRFSGQYKMIFVLLFIL